MSKGAMYILNSGLVNPLGLSAKAVSAAVNSGLSAYAASGHYTEVGQDVIMARVPEGVLMEFSGDVDEPFYYADYYDRVIKFAMIALAQTLKGAKFDKPVPLVMALEESTGEQRDMPASFFNENLPKVHDSLRSDLIRLTRTGRAGGIQALELAGRYMFEADYPFVVVGGSDSYWHPPRVQALTDENRLTARGVANGFVAGEGAAFILLARQPVASRNTHALAIVSHGCAEEAGHLHNREAYTGEAQDKAWKQALAAARAPIDRIYASLNGERYWAKEHGIALLRNQRYLSEHHTVQHPADCFGDLGAATATTLIALAAESLARQPGAALVSSSSDGPWRACACLQSMATNSHEETT